MQLIIYISFVRANSRDYSGITYLYQKLVHCKKIAEQNCSSKNFLDLIKVYAWSFITEHTYSEVSQRVVQGISRCRYCSLFQFHFNYYIIQVSHIKCHVFLLLSAITNNSEVVNYMSTLLTFILPLRNMDTSSSYTVDIIENQNFKIKTLITYEIMTLQIMITILLKIN